MRPEDFFKASGLKFEQLAKTMQAALAQIPGGEREKPLRGTSVRRYFLPRTDPAHRLPRPPLMAAIYVVSDGRVQPNDFYDLPPLDAAAAA